MFICQLEHLYLVAVVSVDLDAVVHDVVDVTADVVNFSRLLLAVQAWDPFDVVEDALDVDLQRLASLGRHFLLFLVGHGVNYKILKMYL